jgi:hypothetical protein
LESLEEARTEEIKEQIVRCEQMEHLHRRAKYSFEDRVREKYTYRGNGDVKDRLDSFIVEYMRRNRLYVEVINVAHGLYIIGAGYSVKAQ